MARFRNNSRQLLAELIYRQPGLKIERIRRYDESVFLPDREVWQYWSFHITLTGTRYVRYGDRSYTLAPSTIFWSSPVGQTLQTYSLAGTRSDIVILTFAREHWHHVYDAEIFRLNNAALLASYPQQPILSLQIAPPQLLHVLRKLIAASDNNHPSTVQNNYVNLLLMQIMDIHFMQRFQRHDHEQRRRVEAAQERICSSLGQPPRLQELAAQLNISLRQLQRDFIALTGLTPVKYRNIIRLSEANELLAETSVPIATIAAELGYPSVSHFSAAFRQIYHCSPREVREEPAVVYGDDTENIEPDTRFSGLETNDVPV